MYESQSCTLPTTPNWMPMCAHVMYFSCISPCALEDLVLLVQRQPVAHLRAVRHCPLLPLALSVRWRFTDLRCSSFSTVSRMLTTRPSWRHLPREDFKALGEAHNDVSIRQLLSSAPRCCSHFSSSWDIVFTFFCPLPFFFKYVLVLFRPEASAATGLKGAQHMVQKKMLRIRSCARYLCCRQTVPRESQTNFRSSQMRRTPDLLPDPSKRARDRDLEVLRIQAKVIRAIEEVLSAAEQERLCAAAAKPAYTTARRGAPCKIQ